MLPSFFFFFARIPSYACPSVAQSLVSSSPIWSVRSLQQTIMDGPPCGKTALLKQINDHLGVVPHSVFQGPNPDATKEDIKKKQHLIMQCYTSQCQLFIKL
jgi:hypothetical protein